MNWIRIASAQDLQDDEVMAVTVGSARIALYCSEGEFFATDNRCTHAEALMSEGYLEAKIAGVYSIDQVLEACDRAGRTGAERDGKVVIRYGD